MDSTNPSHLVAQGKAPYCRGALFHLKEKRARSMIDQEKIDKELEQQAAQYAVSRGLYSSAYLSALQSESRKMVKELEYCKLKLDAIKKLVDVYAEAFTQEQLADKINRIRGVTLGYLDAAD